MKSVNKVMFEAKDGKLFENKEEAQKYENELEVNEKRERIFDLKKKIEKSLPLCKQKVLDDESRNKIDEVPEYLDYKIALYCEYSGKPLVINKAKFHDSGHQYEKGWYETIGILLERPYKIIKIGDIKRVYFLKDFEDHIIPIIKKNEDKIKTYLFYYHTGLI